MMDSPIMQMDSVKYRKALVADRKRQAQAEQGKKIILWILNLYGAPAIFMHAFEHLNRHQLAPAFGYFDCAWVYWAVLVVFLTLVGRPPS